MELVITQTGIEWDFIAAYLEDCNCETLAAKIVAVNDAQSSIERDIRFIESEYDVVEFTATECGLREGEYLT